MEETNVPIAALMAECNCGNPEDNRIVHYNIPGYMCEFIEKKVDTIVTVGQHLNELIEAGRGTSDPSKVMEIMQQPQVNVERCGPRHVNLEILNIPNDQALRVALEILPAALELYLRKSRDYGGNVMDRFGLGPKATVPDLTRKFGKIIDAVWFDKPLQFEQVEEVLQDLFGHILIVLDERIGNDENSPKVTDK